MPKLNQRGVVHLLVPIILFIGIIVGVYLVIEGPKIFNPKAGGLKPPSPETSFTLVTAAQYIDKCIEVGGIKIFCPGTPGDLNGIVVNLYARSDIESANLFSAKLKFPTDLMEVIDIETSDFKEIPPKCEESPKCDGQIIYGDPADPSQCPMYICITPKPRPSGQRCIQVITPACSPTKPSICKDFPTPCDVPDGWIKGQQMTLETVSPNTNNTKENSTANPTEIKPPVSGYYFIKNWLDKSFDNTSGTISIVGGVPSPGYQSDISQNSPLMATIIFKAKKAGQGKITFGDDSSIYSNKDNINLLTIKRDLEVNIAAPKPEPSIPPETEGFEIGIEAGAQSDTSKVDLVSQSGAKWVRLNFIQRDGWVNQDTDTYNKIINAYLDKGIKIIGLIGVESVVGGYNRNNPEEFADRFATTADTIVGKFGDRVKVYELFNEPNDWAGGSSSQVPARYFAQYLEKVYQKVKIEKGRSDIQLISGPLFSFDLTTGADYLRDTYNSFNKSASFPLDGIGYHMYVAQGMGDQSQVEVKLKENINAIKSVIDEKDPGKKIWITEVGWGTGVGRVTEDAQALNLEKTYQVFKDNPAVKLGTWFALHDFDGTEWGLVRTNGVKKKAWLSFLKVTGTNPLPISSPVPSSTPKSNISTGDGNNDGKVNLIDLSILLSDFNKKSGFRMGIDMNGDNVINSFDVSIMRNFLIQKGIIKG